LESTNSLVDFFYQVLGFKRQFNLVQAAVQLPLELYT